MLCPCAVVFLTVDKKLELSNSELEQVGVAEEVRLLVCAHVHEVVWLQIDGRRSDKGTAVVVAKELLLEREFDLMHSEEMLVLLSELIGGFRRSRTDHVLDFAQEELADSRRLELVVVGNKSALRSDVAEPTAVEVGEVHEKVKLLDVARDHVVLVEEPARPINEDASEHNIWLDGLSLG